MGKPAGQWCVLCSTPSTDISPNSGAELNRPGTHALTGYGAAVASPHRLATEAALAIIDRGGNAVDAAITANAVLGVVAPETCGIGGDLMALVHRPGMERPDVLNSSGRAGT